MARSVGYILTVLGMNDEGFDGNCRSTDFLVGISCGRRYSGSLLAVQY